MDGSPRKATKAQRGTNGMRTRFVGGVGQAVRKPRRRFICGSTLRLSSSIGAAITVCSLPSQMNPISIPHSSLGGGIATWSAMGHGSLVSSASWSRKGRAVPITTSSLPWNGIHVPIPSTGRLLMRASRNGGQTAPLLSSASCAPATSLRLRLNSSPCGHCYERCCRVTGWAELNCCRCGRARKPSPYTSGSTSKRASRYGSTRGKAAAGWSLIGAQKTRGWSALGSLHGIHPELKPGALVSGSSQPHSEPWT